MHKVLIANRGEVALRVKRTLDSMGIPSVMVYSSADRGSRHVTEASEAYWIGEGPSSQSYLRQDLMIETAKKSGCDAIHPGYGFLSENADFAEKVIHSGLIFIGPNPQVMRLFGSKISARSEMVSRGVPVAPGLNRPIAESSEIVALAREYGFPVLLKASGGGGGKGMRIVRQEYELLTAFEQCSREAMNSFGDPRVFIEKYLEVAHHIEFQVLGDKHGNALHFGHRECSVQRRHQKLIEETPSPNVSDSELQDLLPLLTKVVRETGYDSLGTFEFLKSSDGQYAFLEMNTRLQVEHSVTEMTYGVDLVELQVRVAFGEVLSLKQDKIRQQGHAIECRICAEDCLADFVPSPGPLLSYKAPLGKDLRVDDFAVQGFEIPLHYDPMIAKLTVHKGSREASIQAMDKALSQLCIEGFPHNILFHRMLLKHPDFVSGQITTSWISNNITLLKSELQKIHTSLKYGALAVAVALQKDWGDLYEKYPLYSRIGEEWLRFSAKRKMAQGACQVEMLIDNQSHLLDVFHLPSGQVHVIFNQMCWQGTSFALSDEKLVVELESTRIIVKLMRPGSVPLEQMKKASQSVGGAVMSPINGKILKVEVSDGMAVAKGQLLLILEAMKMENEIRSPIDATVVGLSDSLLGSTVGKGDFLLELKPREN